jgi:hypothetical protein
MQTPIIQQIRDLTTQLEINNKEISEAKSELEELALLKRNNILVQKRYELAKQLGLTSWDGIL